MNSRTDTYQYLRLLAQVLLLLDSHANIAPSVYPVRSQVELSKPHLLSQDVQRFATFANGVDMS